MSATRMLNCQASFSPSAHYCLPSLSRAWNDRESSTIPHLPPLFHYLPGSTSHSQPSDAQRRRAIWPPLGTQHCNIALHMGPRDLTLYQLLTCATLALAQQVSHRQPCSRQAVHAVHAVHSVHALHALHALLTLHARHAPQARHGLYTPQDLRKLHTPFDGSPPTRLRLATLAALVTLSTDVSPTTFLAYSDAAVDMS